MKDFRSRAEQLTAKVVDELFRDAPPDGYEIVKYVPDEFDMPKMMQVQSKADFIYLDLYFPRTKKIQVYCPETAKIKEHVIVDISHTDKFYHFLKNKNMVRYCI